MDSTLTEKKVLNLDKANWVLTKIGELAQDISKRVENPAESEYDRFVGLGNFVSGDIKIKSWETTENLVSSAKAFQAGDVLFARRNAYLRRSSLVDFDGCCSGDAFVLRENHAKLVPGYLAFLMNSNALWDYANANAAGTMSKRVKWRDLAEYEFLLPPKGQQAQLVKLLWAMDEVVDREVNIREKATDLLSSLIENSYLEIPQNSKFSISDIISSLTAGVSVNNKKGNPSKNDLVVLKTSAVTGTEFSPQEAKIVLESEIHKLKRHLKNDTILINRKNTPELVGRLKYIEFDYPNIYLPDLIWELEANKEKVIPKFLAYYLSSNFFRTNINSIYSGTSLSMVNISQKNFLKLFIKIPSKNKQLLLLEKFSQAENLLKSSNKKIATSQALQKSLINQIF